MEDVVKLPSAMMKIFPPYIFGYWKCLAEETL